MADIPITRINRNTIIALANNAASSAIDLNIASAPSVVLVKILFSKA